MLGIIGVKEDGSEFLIRLVYGDKASAEKCIDKLPAQEKEGYKELKIDEVEDFD